MDAEGWDRRYSGKDLVWGADPNRWVEQECAPLPAGRALDLACGEGRNAIWLARRGWRVTAVDFSQVALARGAELAAASDGPGDGGTIEWVRADVFTYAPEPKAYDLVVIAYLQVPPGPRRAVVRAAAQALAPGGRLVVVAHDSANLERGVGGPQDPDVLYTAQDLAGDLAGTAGEPAVLRAEAVRRPVLTPDGERCAIDALFVASSPAATRPYTP